MGKKKAQTSLIPELELDMVERSSKELSVIFDVEVRTVQLWESKRKWLQKNSRGLYNLFGAIRGVYQGQLAIISKKKPDDDGNSEALETQKQKKVIEKMDFEIKKLRGDLRDTRKVGRVALSRANMMGDSMDALPSRIDAILAAEDDKFKIRKLLKKELDIIRKNSIKESQQSTW